MMQLRFCSLIRPHSPATLRRHMLRQELREELDIDVRVLGIASSSRMLLSEEGVDLSAWRDDFSQCVTYAQDVGYSVQGNCANWGCRIVSKGSPMISGLDLAVPQDGHEIRCELVLLFWPHRNQPNQPVSQAFTAGRPQLPGQPPVVQLHPQRRHRRRDSLRCATSALSRGQHESTCSCGCLPTLSNERHACRSAMTQCRLQADRLPFVVQMYD